MALNQFVNTGSDVNLMKSMSNDPTINQEELIKGMNKAGLVQKQITVHGKNGDYQAMKWVKATDDQPADKPMKKQDEPKAEKAPKKKDDQKSTGSVDYNKAFSFMKKNPDNALALKFYKNKEDGVQYGLMMENGTIYYVEDGMANPYQISEDEAKKLMDKHLKGKDMKEYMMGDTDGIDDQPSDSSDNKEQKASGDSGNEDNDKDASAQWTKPTDKASLAKLLQSGMSRNDIMANAEKDGVTWKHSDHEGINWMRCSMALTGTTTRGNKAKNGSSGNQSQSDQSNAGVDNSGAGKSGSKDTPFGDYQLKSNEKITKVHGMDAVVSTNRIGEETIERMMVPTESGMVEISKDDALIMGNGKISKADMHLSGSDTLFVGNVIFSSNSSTKPGVYTTSTGEKKFHVKGVDKDRYSETLVNEVKSQLSSAEQSTYVGMKLQELVRDKTNDIDNWQQGFKDKKLTGKYNQLYFHTNDSGELRIHYPSPDGSIKDWSVKEAYNFFTKKINDEEKQASKVHDPSKPWTKAEIKREKTKYVSSLLDKVKTGKVITLKNGYGDTESYAYDKKLDAFVVTKKDGGNGTITTSRYLPDSDEISDVFSDSMTAGKKLDWDGNQWALNSKWANMI
jgi:hypothetical protein